MGAAVYVRGDDMPDFPGKTWVEARMPVYLLPRTAAVSSTFIKHISGGTSKQKGGTVGGEGQQEQQPVLKGEAALAVFASLDYTGKPRDAPLV